MLVLLLTTLISLRPAVSAPETLDGKGVNSGAQSNNSDAKLQTPQLIEKYGYPCETHKVTTDDGYILTVHRIPNGKNAPPAPPEGRSIVWLQHGLLMSSSDWLYQNKDQPLGFRLADAGYDVWLGNFRGNTYSKGHRHLDVKSEEYWSFTWHEMGQYDLPAFFDLVQNVTGKPNLFYIGHSMGTTAFFVCMSLRPKYNSRIRLMSALSPVVYLANSKGPIKSVAPLLSHASRIGSLFGLNELLPNTQLSQMFSSTLCNDKSPMQKFCSNLLFLIVGYDEEQLNKTMLPVILGHTPAGASVKTISHFAQNIVSRGFRHFDYGLFRNMNKYGQVQPPEYDLTKVTAPVALYYAKEDWFANPEDVRRLADKLPNVKRSYVVPFDKFNHQDYLWAMDVVPLLYQTMEEFMSKY